jgi:hypothetical protein
MNGLFAPILRINCLISLASMRLAQALLKAGRAGEKF